MPISAMVLSVFFLYCISPHVVYGQCNGGLALCNQSYSDITHLVTHDSYANLTPNLASTQERTIVEQLNDGVRGLKLSAVPSVFHPEEIHLCHTSCLLLNAGKAVDTLNTIADWVADHPNEVVTIMWNNLYSFTAEQLASVYTASRMMPFIYDLYNGTHHLQGDGKVSQAWPTLQQMIDGNKRVVNFIDAEADMNQVPWLIDQFSICFETPYDYTDPSQFNCNVDRIADGLSPSSGDDKEAVGNNTPSTEIKNMMYVLNHFLYGSIEVGSFKVEIPQRHKARQTNSRASLMPHVQNCTRTFHKKPTFLEVDFYSIGDALSVAAELNQAKSPSDVLELTIDTAAAGADVIPSEPSEDTNQSKLSPTQHVLIDNQASKSSIKSRLCLLFVWAATATLLMPPPMHSLLLVFYDFLK
ncbi:PLC-like phosphodiesterase [Mycotypha africana]|uniref:PLC-like phosphodiesterase n=1 Tax=Mycotypha africana TaxID=64632 RepID=UPI0022FFC800|nr:PLC-like phosphodiesterase [Mycotypha africana]KAI8984495.1 PLC-like phosphodiesterase [Mycotypha africana]